MMHNKHVVYPKILTVNAKQQYVVLLSMTSRACIDTVLMEIARLRLVVRVRRRVLISMIMDNVVRTCVVPVVKKGIAINTMKPEYV